MFFLKAQFLRQEYTFFTNILVEMMYDINGVVSLRVRIDAQRRFPSAMRFLLQLHVPGRVLLLEFKLIALTGI